MPNTLLITTPTLDNLEAFIAQHRALYGETRMEADPAPEGDGAPTGDDPPADPPADPEPAESPALVEERNARKAAETVLSEMLGKSKAEVRKALKSGSLDDLRPAAPADPTPPDADQIRRDAEAAATEKANGRIVSAEVRALAAELFADPSDAPMYLDLSNYEVDDDGSVDTKQITTDLKAVLIKKPHLAKTAGRPKPDRSQGRGGADGADSKPGLDRMRSAYANTSST